MEFLNNVPEDQGIGVAAHCKNPLTIERIQLDLKAKIDK
jgi:hypothetical protein